MQNQEVPLRCEWYSMVSIQIREYVLTVPLSQEKEEEPVVKIMVDDAIVIKNYFSLPILKTDTSKAPLHFPVPQQIRYLVKEVSSSGIFMEKRFWNSLLLLQLKVTCKVNFYIHLFGRPIYPFHKKYISLLFQELLISMTQSLSVFKGETVT